MAQTVGDGGGRKVGPQVRYKPMKSQGKPMKPKVNRPSTPGKPMKGR